MIESILDAVAQSLRDRRHELRAERTTDGIAAERKRQSGNLLPPFAEIDDPVQA